ncbi:MAG: hypothetical protein KDD56_05075 [Bdellovibrionales bacterium]|nr:hypothetical protein [Bdellovibrionales bacterium]
MVVQVGSSLIPADAEILLDGAKFNKRAYMEGRQAGLKNDIEDRQNKILLSGYGSISEDTIEAYLKGYDDGRTFERPLPRSKRLGL